MGATKGCFCNFTVTLSTIKL
uniref:Uncharacterized protein n=1 Tax=Rhizophora mucronata TaxID=61149 RepID=A0A2P2PAA8_RHIMU